jgi:hypothetical protein
MKTGGMARRECRRGRRSDHLTRGWGIG